MTTRQIFDNHIGDPISKWTHYFQTYDFYFKRFINEPHTFMEIGVWKGGSIQMWRKLLGPYVKIIGIDIDENCKKHHNPDEGIYIYIGDQSDENFLQKILEEHNNIAPNIILDDGSHVPKHQIKSFNFFFPKQRQGDIYLVEDIEINEKMSIDNWNKSENNTFCEYINSLNYQMYSNINDEGILNNAININYTENMIAIKKGNLINRKSIRAGRFSSIREKLAPIKSKFDNKFR